MAQSDSAHDETRDVRETLNVPEQVGMFVRARSREHEPEDYVWENAGRRTHPDDNNPIDGVQVKQLNDDEYSIFVLRWAFEAETLSPLTTLPVSFPQRRLAFAVAKDMMECATIASEDTTDAMLAYTRSIEEDDE